MSNPTFPTDDTLAELLVTLVNTRSVTRHEHAISELVATRLEALGKGEVTRVRRSIVWRGPQRGRPLVVLAGHLDTVRAQGNKVARRENGSVHGLGSTDMKAGITVMLALLDRIDPEAPRFDLACVFYDGEEGPAARNGLKRVFRRQRWVREARIAILLEPTALAVELGCNGSVNLEITVPGQSAHAARPWLGRNAVRVGADWLSRIVQEPTGAITIGGVEFRETMEIVRVRAGSARNVLPGEMKVSLNHRYTPDHDPDEAIARVQALVPPEFVTRVRSASPPGRVCHDDVFVQEFIALTGRVPAGKQGWTDVARFTAHGVAAFNYGPGLPELCHRPDEHCPESHLGEALRTLERWLHGA